VNYSLRSDLVGSLQSYSSKSILFGFLLKRVWFSFLMSPEVNISMVFCYCVRSGSGFFRRRFFCFLREELRAPLEMMPEGCSSSAMWSKVVLPLNISRFIWSGES